MINLSCPTVAFISVTILRLVCRRRHVTTAPGPVDVDVLALRVLRGGVLRLDLESVSTEVVTLGLEQVRRQVLGAVAIEPRQRRRESRGRDTEQRRLGNNVSPARLSLVDSLVEEVIEQQVLQVGVVAVRSRDILEEHGPDNAASSPHEGDRGLVELPPVLLGSLCSPFCQ